MSSWIRSSRCEAGHCLQVCVQEGRVLVRNNSYPEAEPISFTFDQWPWFLHEVARHPEHPWAWFRDSDDIVYSQEDALAFQAGVKSGEFDLDRLLEIDNH